MREPRWARNFCLLASASGRWRPRGSGGGTGRILVTPDEPVRLDPRELSLLPSLADTEHLPITDMRRAFDKVLRFPAHLRSFSESAGDPALRRLI